VYLSDEDPSGSHLMMEALPPSPSSFGASQPYSPFTPRRSPWFSFHAAATTMRPPSSQIDASSEADSYYGRAVHTRTGVRTTHAPSTSGVATVDYRSDYGRSEARMTHTTAQDSVSYYGTEPPSSNTQTTFEMGSSTGGHGSDSDSRAFVQGRSEKAAYGEDAQDPPPYGV
jgi:hypothetical protein